MLSSGFQPIHLFRYDPEMQTVYVLAGVTEGIQVIVDPNGKWRFADE
jgi:hypothetical protein